MTDEHMKLMIQTVVNIGHTKADLIYQVEAIEQGRPYSGWPNEQRRVVWEQLKSSPERVLVTDPCARPKPVLP